MSDIFISYSKSDRAKAQLLATALERQGWPVWWDPKIPPGETFDEVIEQALEAARCVIVSWSKKSVTSRWVKAEASEGNRRRILMPALIEDDVRIPLEFRYQHAARLTDWEGQEGHLEFEQLKVAIAQLLGTSRTTTSPLERGVQDRHQDGAKAKQPGGSGSAKPVATAPEAARQQAISDDVDLNTRNGLMWTIDDSGNDINWHEADEYARQLWLGGYSDWRLPKLGSWKGFMTPVRTREQGSGSPSG